MTTIRQAAVAGLFYPASPGELEHQVRSMLANADVAPRTAHPKAIIVPHAGYIYSGPTAASAFSQLEPLRNTIRHVVLLGPCHRVPLQGIASSSADYFETPLGRIPLNRDAINRAETLPQVINFDMTHAQEHSLEVQLPFLQVMLDEFSLTPLVVGDASADDVAEVIEALWGDDKTLFVISSDLSHYHEYTDAQRMDQATCRSIENLNADAIHYDQACGRNPVIGLLTVARKFHLDVTTLDLRNSGDTAGDRERVVGYGAWKFEAHA